jgi:hypothetical protein
MPVAAITCSRLPRVEGEHAGHATMFPLSCNDKSFNRLVMRSVNCVTPPCEGDPTADSDFKPGAISYWELGVGVE